MMVVGGGGGGGGWALGGIRHKPNKVFSGTLPPDFPVQTSN